MPLIAAVPLTALIVGSRARLLRKDQKFKYRTPARVKYSLQTGEGPLSHDPSRDLRSSGGLEGEGIGAHPEERPACVIRLYHKTSVLGSELRESLFSTPISGEFRGTQGNSEFRHFLPIWGCFSSILRGFCLFRGTSGVKRPLCNLPGPRIWVSVLSLWQLRRFHLFHMFLLDAQLQPARVPQK